MYDASTAAVRWRSVISRSFTRAALACCIAAGASWLILAPVQSASASSLTPSEVVSSSHSSLALSSADLSSSLAPQSELLTLTSLSTSLSPATTLSVSSSDPVSQPSSSPSSSSSVSAISDPALTTTPVDPSLDYLRQGVGLVVFLLAAMFARTFGPEWRP